MPTPDLIEEKAAQALESAIAWSFGTQRVDGHWVGEVLGDASFTSEYVFLRYGLGLDLAPDGTALKQWLLGQQNEDGSWSLAPQTPGNLSVTVEAYLALKMLGLSARDPHLVRAKDFLLRLGGVAKVRFLTRFYLAMFGLFPWAAVPQIPAELILMPSISPINIYTLSSWARSTLIPFLIIRHHEPVHALPNGQRPNNDFLDEIWCDPCDKMVPYVRPLGDMLREGNFFELAFTIGDSFLAGVGGLRTSPTRDLSRRKCLEWILHHQEETGEWCGILPAMCGSIWALVLEGYSLEHKAVYRGLEALERMSVQDERGKRCQVSVSPVWDTAWMLNALCGSRAREDNRVSIAVNWLKEKQILDRHGDWGIYQPNIPPGGWSFQYANTWYPDLDDSAVAIYALIKHDPRCVTSQHMVAAIRWVLGMQNKDGGWAAFDHNNNKLFLNQIPLGDMDNLCDPSTPDLTGRVLDCFGPLLSNPDLDVDLRRKIKRASRRGIDFLLAAQDPSGAWWGRWGCNFLYGTSIVLRGLSHFAHDSQPLRDAIRRAISWVKAVQNGDGGWGETLQSYVFPELAGRGETTPAQTAWALLALLPYCSTCDPAIHKGISRLIAMQTVRSDHGTTWPVGLYTATGFPKTTYSEYSLYPHYFPVLALTRYLASSNGQGAQPIQISAIAMRIIRQPQVLMMVLGSQEEFQAALCVARTLTHTFACRVRIATHPKYQTLVQTNGIEFFDVGGIETSLGWTSLFMAVLKGDLSAMRRSWHVLDTTRRSFHDMARNFWRSCMDYPADMDHVQDPSSRPFLADIIVSNWPAMAHVHAAENLKVPLVMLSNQPLVPTADFPHPYSLMGVQSVCQRFWNFLSYVAVECL